MTPFDLLFVLVFLAAVALLGLAAVQAGRGRLAHAARLLVGLVVGLVLYLALVVAVSLMAPPRTVAAGENRCFDDWCMGVVAVTHTATETAVVYTVTLRLTNQARRVAQREQGVVVYLVDETGQSFAAAVDETAVPFNVLLQPSEVVTTTRTFRVPTPVGALRLAVAHDGGRRFPGLFIINDDSSLGHQPTWLSLPLP